MEKCQSLPRSGLEGEEWLWGSKRKDRRGEGGARSGLGFVEGIVTGRTMSREALAGNARSGGRGETAQKQALGEEDTRVSFGEIGDVAGAIAGRGGEVAQRQALGEGANVVGFEDLGEGAGQIARGVGGRRTMTGPTRRII